MTKRPNILIILCDDMGFSDLGCYGGEIETPNLDALARNGLRYTQFYNTARCCPSRASLLTGLYPHQANIGEMTADYGYDGYRGDLSADSVTIAEALKPGGYVNYISGKWHVSHEMNKPTDSWPRQRGFDDFYGTLMGCSNYFQPRTLARNNDPASLADDYYITDAIADHAVRQIGEHAGRHGDKPFFQYVAFTAPHWPLHAREKDIEKYKGRFDAGWDVLRRQRHERMVDMGIVSPDWPLSPRHPDAPAWEDAPNKEWQARRMEVYAAQIDSMDQGIGRILQALRDSGQFDNTLVIFLSDNGGEALEVAPGWSTWLLDYQCATAKTRDGRDVRFGNDPSNTPGPEESYTSYGLSWANLSNTPFRFFKMWIHEGGIATPFIVHWPNGIEARNELRHQPAQLPDIMATLLDLTGIPYPETYRGHAVQPLEGVSMVPTFSNQPHARDTLCWEHLGNEGIRRGKWKLVRLFQGAWELYDIEADRTEGCDLASNHPRVVRELSDAYDAWATRCNVVPREEVLERRRRSP